MIDLSKYPASWRSYYSHVDRGGAVCAGIACLAIIPIIPPAGRGHLSFLPIVAVIVASPVALCDGGLRGEFRGQTGVSSHRPVGKVRT